MFLLLAAASKVDGWRGWTSSTARLLPQSRLVRVAASIAVPTVEALVAIAVLFEPRIGLLLAGVLLLCFSVAVLLLTARHRGEPCRCFGTVVQSRLGPGLATIDAVLGMIALGASLSWGTALEPPSAGTIGLSLLGLLLVVLSLEFFQFRSAALPLRLEGGEASE